MMKAIYTIFILLATLASTSVDAKTFLTEKELLSQAFPEAGKTSDSKHNKQTLWLDDALQSKIENILSHPYPKLRIKYWKNEKKTVWVLEEIGKVKPITFGFVITDNQVELARVLTFRESRGYEIANQSFYQQFNQTKLIQDYQLSKQIDGISGATMSVSAMKKIAKLALMLHQEVMK
ncbi:MAG: FMN-binding protein [Gammaproteobacteria bacterium]|nr:FMN-binding protein [Gammaproteobacteria bacterium]